MSDTVPAIVPHGRFEEILAAVGDLKDQARPWNGMGFRFAAVSHAAPGKILSGRGSQEYGGRWNAAGTFPAVYCSLLPETAVSESMNRFRRSGLKPLSPLPGVLVSIEIKLHKVLDLSQPGDRMALDPFLAKAKKENWQKLQDQGREAFGHAIGRAVWQLGLEGILFSSVVVQDGGNLCIYPDNLHSKSMLRIENESILRKYVLE